MKRKFKKAISLFLAVLMLMSALPLIAGAEESFTEGYYTYTVSGENATITDVDDSISGDIVIPSKLGGYTVTKIGNSAFSGTAIESVVIRDNIETIGRYAFSGAELKRVSFESEKRNLFIDQGAFANCKKLSAISLCSDALYGISTDAFKNTAFFNNEDNWDNDGVLYINDIILAVNERFPQKYTIRAGTRLAADYLAPIVYVDPEEEYIAPEITIPDSLDNFGAYSLVYENTDNIFRAGRIYFALVDTDILGLQYQWTEEYGYDTSSKNIPLNAIKALPVGLFILTQVENGFVDSIQPWWIGVMQKDNIKYELYTFEGMKGFADDNSFVNPPTFSVSPTHCDGYILSDSVELVGRFTPFGATNTAYAMHFYGGDDRDLSLQQEKSLTFLNPDCRINDCDETIWSGYTICGYKDSTAYEYAMKHNRKFVDISNCDHSEKALRYAMDANCSRDGYTGDVYCQYCGEFLEEGTIISYPENHSFGEWEKVSDPTCIKDGERKRICEFCGKEETEIYQTAFGHEYVEDIIAATCTNRGKKITRCKNCYLYETETIPVTDHMDEDGDYFCDACGAKLTIDCSCNCHKDGILGFFYKLARFFWKLFGINQICGCGAYHY